MVQIERNNDVSIHSRPPGREKRSLRRFELIRTEVSIHSRPPGREKRGHRSVRRRGCPVSIHSRPPGREKRGNPIHREFSRRGFNPLPPTRTGETKVVGALLPITVFQSTPAHQDGRNVGAQARFVGQAVSIHSRPPGREKPRERLHRATPEGFNPLPPTRTGET